MKEKGSGPEALRRSEARLRALLDAIPDLMIRFDRDGTYTDICGNVSGGATGLGFEVLDYDEHAIWDAYEALARAKHLTKRKAQ